VQSKPSKAAVEYDRKKIGLDLHCGILKDCNFPNESFDVITLLDCFQYIPDPNSDLIEIQRILKRGGRLIIEIAGLNLYLFRNTGILCRLLFGLPSQLGAGGRLYYYSSKTLSLLLKKHGFKLSHRYPGEFSEAGSLPIIKRLRRYYSLASKLLYRLTLGKVNWVPYEYLVFQK
jgi:SAM-dependent methyltransferase